MIKVPEAFKSSKGDGSIARTVKGVGSTIVFVGAMYTPYTESEWAQGINLALVAAAAIYAAYGFYKKMYNKYHGTNS